MKGAAALSQVVIAAGSLSGVALILHKKSPVNDREPLINYNLVLLMLPALLLGVALGNQCFLSSCTYDEVKLGPDSMCSSKPCMIDTRSDWCWACSRLLITSAHSSLVMIVRTNLGCLIKDENGEKGRKEALR